MARNLLLEGCVVGAAMALLCWVVQCVFPRLDLLMVAAIAGLAGHLGFEALGLNAAFCRRIMM